MNDLKFVLDTYKDKDERGKTYFLTVKGIEKDGSEVTLLSHVGDKTATGYDVLKKVAARAKRQFDRIIVEEYNSFSPGSSGATVAATTYKIALKQNKTPAIMDSQVTEIFGGLSGFGQFREEQGRVIARLETMTEKIEDLKEEKAQLLAKLGNYEQEQKASELEIKKLEGRIRDLRWEKEDTERKLTTRHAEELRKYKGQSAIIQAGVQGLGGLLVKKLNISDSDLQGLLGMDAPTQTQTAQNGDAFDENVEVEPENLNPEQQKAKQIYDWLLMADKNTMDKVYAVFQSLSSDEENLNAYYAMADPENMEVDI